MNNNKNKINNVNKIINNDIISKSNYKRNEKRRQNINNNSYNFINDIDIIRNYL